MIRRVRMARKRLAIARESYLGARKAENSRCENGWIDVSPAWNRVDRRWLTLRAIERRKDRIA